MCDASNSTLGAVLGQRVDKQSHIISTWLQDYSFLSPCSIEISAEEAEREAKTDLVGAASSRIQPRN
ncbi:hypothetical protein CR513_15933, partial [Mucuna pruriens]